MKKKTIALFVLLFAAFLGLQTGTSAAESHIEIEDAPVEDGVMIEVTSELTDEERAALIKEISLQIELLQQAVEDLQVLVAQVIEAQGATFVEAPAPPAPIAATPVTPEPTPIAIEEPSPFEGEVEVIDLAEDAASPPSEEDIFASIQGDEEEVDVGALFAGTDIDPSAQAEGGSRLIAAFGNPENRGAFVLIAAFIVGGILFALSRRKKGPKPAPKAAEQKVEPQPTTPSFDQAPWG